MRLLPFLTSASRPIIGAMFLFLIITSCAPPVSQYSDSAYRQAVELKVVSLDLIEHATQPFGAYDDEVRALRLELEKAYEFSKGRPDNEFSTQQWAIMIDPERNMLGGFLRRWEERGSMPEVFVNEARQNIADGFDTIIDLESGKIEPGDLP